MSALWALVGVNALCAAANFIFSRWPRPSRLNRWAGIFNAGAALFLATALVFAP